MTTAPLEFFTIGYGKWPAARRFPALTAALSAAGVDLLVDVRHSPCASQLDPANAYGPRAWSLQPGGAGIAAELAAAGIEYRWAVELGNPQKTDPDMLVLREHLADTSRDWPVHRGLALVAGWVRDEGRRCALLCACGRYADCHRRPVTEALLARLPAGTRHRDLTG